MQHVIFAQYIGSQESTEITEIILDNNCLLGRMTIQQEKRLLKKHGHQQKGHTVIITDDKGIKFLKKSRKDLKTMTWDQAVA